ncbi:hypothetical protein D6D13_08280 [Aureobasidium pullulans]|uniref:Uncharacterized protein n=1 Tax=Aureobasidium pullulans TaxID=5580 RepID=A0A4S9C6Y2_AURPU|nr:hypothetical protein D6D13_08280 [Aureobasidium pullulans]
MDSLKSSFFGRLFTDNRITAEIAGLVTQPTLTPSVTAVSPITVFVPMATINQPTPGLLKCPNEVLANIFSNPGLSKNDIKALRLSVRPALLHNPFVILSRYALEALVEICEDPIFSPHVQSIGFLTTTLHPDDPTKKALGELNAFTQFSAEQVHLESSGKAERLLARAISALGRPMVVTVTNDIDSISPIGVSKVPSNRYYNRLYDPTTSNASHHYGKFGYLDVHSRMRDLLRVVTRAIYQMELGDRGHFEGLKIKLKQRSYMPQRYDCLGSLQASEGIYECLTSLHLEMDCASLREKGSLAALQHLFTVVPCLQKLTFITSWARGNTIATLLLTNISRWLETPSKFNLRTLVLQEVACTQETLLFIVKRHSETLREIELSGVTLLGSWKECISWMMENLHLETFRIKDACSITHGRKTNHGRFIPADCLVAPTDLVGKEDTRVGLEKLLKHKFEK